LNEAAELEVMLELGEGFGTKGAAADMKFCAALWLSLQCQKAFCNTDRVELSRSGWGVV